MTSAESTWGEVLIFDEPELEFGNGQHASDPRDGLAMYGPFSLGRPSHPHGPPYVVIGPPEGAQAFLSWAEAMNRPFAHAQAEKHRLWPPYPGYEVAFGDRWSTKPSLTVELDRDALLDASRKKDSHERTYAVVDQYLRGFERIRKLDAKVAVAVCVVPEEVWMNCRPESRVLNPLHRHLPAAPQRRRWWDPPLRSVLGL